MAEELTYHLDQFDGPLDLLLTLIEKNKVEITDIPIALICDQYMAYIEEAQRMDLEIACEFIVMASQLMLIKSKMLLPRQEEEEKDPRAELVDALLIYQKAKKDADELRPLYDAFSGRMVKDVDEIPPERGLPLGLDPHLLSLAMTKMLSRLKEQEKAPTMVAPLIKVKIVNVEEKIGQVVQKLSAVPEASFFSLLKDAADKPELIATFMGILELIKIGRILFCDLPDEEDVTLAVCFRLNPDYVPSSEMNSEFDNDAPTPLPTEGAGKETGKTDKE